MNKRKRLIFLAKLVFSTAIIAWIVTRIVNREGADDLWARLTDLSWPWIAVAALMQVCAIAASVLRWDRLLVGQGIHAPLRHLAGSFMIGRFFGAFTPGGWTGLNGYRLYDIAVHTGKTARSTATIGIEMVLGNLAFSIVVILGSLYGLEVIGLQGVLMVDGFFAALVCAAILVISRPTLVRAVASHLPAAFHARLQTTLDAVCAYQGQGGLVTLATLLGVATHTFNNLIYLATAHALGVELSLGTIFFVTAMQIFSTLLPASVNGIGVREATAVALYTSLGVPVGLAFLIPTVGFTVEMFISSFGGLIFMARRVGYSVEIRVDAAEREQIALAHIEKAPIELRPAVGRGTALALGGWLLAGAVAGAAEGAVIASSGAARIDLEVFVYAIGVYGLCLGAVGIALGAGLAYSGRLLGREALAETQAYARHFALALSTMAFTISAFRLRRDLFREAFAWKSLQGLLLLGGCALGALLLFLILSALVRALLARSPGRLLLKAWGTPAVLAAIWLAVAATSAALDRTDPRAPLPPAHEAKRVATRPPSNIIFIIVDTLRADHLPLYGYDKIETPNLDGFARDAILFEKAFANASWTRPSFASSLSGRYSSSHKTVTKFDSFPDEVVSLPEVLRANGYATCGVVSNYNLAPFFNFHQGFDSYRYLEPDFILGAGDAAAKLLLLQILRRVDEKVRDRLGKVRKGSDYQDAEAVNRAILGLLDRAPSEPWFVFAAYMDPHDPYYAHPYDGTGQSRAAKQKPDPKEAPRLMGLYDGEIAYWDGHFGRLLSELRRRELYDNATIVVTSDHGEEFMEHGGFWHGTTLYDEQIRVPLLLKLPGNRRGGSVVGHWVESIDVMPTLLKQAESEIPAGVQGKDLFVGSQQLFAEENLEGNILQAFRYRQGEAELKLITANQQNPRGLKPLELYRVDADPEELKDLSEAERERAEAGRRELESYAGQAERGAVQRRSVEMSDEQKERLRRLGYMVD